MTSEAAEVTLVFCSAAIPARRSVVFPIPAAPSSSSAPGSDSADTTKPLTAASSFSLLMTSEAAEVTLVFCSRIPSR